MPPDYSPGSVYHRARRDRTRATEAALRFAIQTLGPPQSLLDLGCGEGWHLAVARDLGVQAIGVDIGIEPGRERAGYVHADLRVPLDLGHRLEWVCCWEVAEHLPRESAAILCDTIARHTMRPHGRVIWTAAQPGQAGDGHINCEDKLIWCARMLERGLWLQPDETRALASAWRLVRRAPWYARNVQVFAWA